MKSCKVEESPLKKDGLQGRCLIYTDAAVLRPYFFRNLSMLPVILSSFAPTIFSTKGDRLTLRHCFGSIHGLGFRCRVKSRIKGLWNPRHDCHRLHTGGHPFSLEMGANPHIKIFVGSSRPDLPRDVGRNVSYTWKSVQKYIPTIEPSRFFQSGEQDRVDPSTNGGG